jgi:hypothetical protein
MIITFLPTKVQIAYQAFFVFYEQKPIQDALSALNCYCGFQATHRLTQTFVFNERTFSIPPALKQWNPRTLQIIYLMADLSYVINGLVNSIALDLSKCLIKHITSEALTEKIIGPQGIFNDTVIKCLKKGALVLGIPSTLITLYLLTTQAKKITKKKKDSLTKAKDPLINELKYRIRHARVTDKTVYTLSKINQIYSALS